MVVATERSVTRLAGALGAEVRGVDLTTMTDSQFDDLRSAWLEHLVLIIPGQHLDEASQLAFGQRFGEVTVHPLYAGKGAHPEVMVIANRGKAASITEIWHSDTSSLAEPPMATVLCARRLPPFGGDTSFANQYLAYETLTPAMRTLLEGLRSVHESASETNLHPVVRTHPETGRRALFVNRYFVKRFEGMSEEESQGLLDFLFEQSVRPEFTFRHRWTEGDVVIWDNRCTLHYAIHDYGDEPRVMHRINIRGDAPR